MSLHKRKSDRQKLPSTYPRDHPIFQEIHERYCSVPVKSNADSKAAKQPDQAASDSTDIIEGNILPTNKRRSDRDAVSDLIKNDFKSIMLRKPNYFITLSMEGFFTKDWKNYDRQYQLAKLHKCAAVLIYKLFTLLAPKLKSVDYKYWPFFFGTVEHFDKEGNLVTPHIHILTKYAASLTEITEIVTALWAQAVPEAGETGVDVQIIEPEHLMKRVRYILKDCHQDGLETLKNGVNPHEVCKRYGWPLEAVSHEQWRLNRDTLHKARTTKHPVLKANNPSKKIKSALRKIYPNLSESKLAEKRELLENRGLISNGSINNNVPASPVIKG